MQQQRATPLSRSWSGGVAHPHPSPPPQGGRERLLVVNFSCLTVYKRPILCILSRRSPYAIEFLMTLPASNVSSSRYFLSRGRIHACHRYPGDSLFRWRPITRQLVAIPRLHEYRTRRRQQSAAHGDRPQAICPLEDTNTERPFL